MVRSTSLSPGAEMITFFAPACRCAPAFALLVKKPVHSSTTSTPSAFQGSFDGSRSATTWMRSPFTASDLSFTSTVPGKRAVRRVVLRRCALVLASPRSLMATNCRACFLPPS